LTIVSFLIFGGYVMRPIYNKWQIVPTITSVETTNYPIWNIYFPAVTICSNNKIEMQKIDAILKKEPWLSLYDEYDNFEEDLKLALATTLTFETDRTTFNETIKNKGVEKILKGLKENMSLLAQKALPSCLGMILHCEWQGQVVECGDLFGIRRTDFGFCCSFNTLKLSEQL